MASISSFRWKAAGHFSFFSFGKNCKSVICVKFIVPSQQRIYSKSCLTVWGDKSALPFLQFKYFKSKNNKFRSLSYASVLSSFFFLGSLPYLSKPPLMMNCRWVVSSSCSTSGLHQYNLYSSIASKIFKSPKISVVGFKNLFKSKFRAL